MRTIRVTGKGQLKVHPDMTVISIELEGRYPAYDDTLRHSSEDTEKLKSILAPFGFERADLKTVSFDIDTEYESYEERQWKRTEYKRRLIGYKYTHRMKVEFESDNDRLGRILYALAACELKPEFRISYTVRDPEAAKNELLGRAVSDAKAKAAVLAEAGGVPLGKIQTIDYSWGEVRFEAEPMRRFAGGFECPDAAPMVKFDIDIEPDDIEVSDTVTIIWEIG